MPVVMFVHADRLKCQEIYICHRGIYFNYFRSFESLELKASILITFILSIITNCSLSNLEVEQFHLFGQTHIFFLASSLAQSVLYSLTFSVPRFPVIYEVGV